MSIFRFLSAPATFTELEDAPLLGVWACDFATAAMVVRSGLPPTRFDPIVVELARLLDAREVLQIRARLRAARSA